MVAISPGYHGGDGKGTRGVPGGKATTFAKYRDMALKKSIVQIVFRGDVDRTQPAAYKFHGHMGDSTVGISFTGKERRLRSVRSMEKQSSKIERSRNSRLNDSGITTTEMPAVIAEVGGIPEIAHVVGINSDKTGGDSDDC